MRGLHSDKSAAVFNEGFKAYYNFVRPNQALKGKTPAEAAGVDLKLGENRWLELVKKAMENKGTSQTSSMLPQFSFFYLFYELLSLLFLFLSGSINDYV
jgi:hypothetical protein